MASVAIVPVLVVAASKPQQIAQAVSVDTTTPQLSLLATSSAPRLFSSPLPPTPASLLVPPLPSPHTTLLQVSVHVSPVPLTVQTVFQVLNAEVVRQAHTSTVPSAMPPAPQLLLMLSISSAKPAM